MKSISLRIWIAGIIAVSIIVLLPLFRPGFIVTDDGDWMIIRLSAFYQSFREGQFPVRFLGRLNNSYGYPVANFLYPGFLYLGSIIHYLGVPFIATIKIILALSVVTGGISVFLWLRRFGSEMSAFIGSVSFVSGSYLLFDIYKRGSVGEVLAISVAAFCFYLIDSEKYSLFGFFFAFLLISHNSLALLFGLVFLFILLVRKKVQGIISWAFGVGIATFFWFPALYEKAYVVFDRVKISNPEQYFVTGDLMPLIGFSALIALGIFLSTKKNKSVSRVYVYGFIIASFLSTPLSLLIWRINIFSQLFQFPYRILSVSLLFGVYLIARGIDEIPRHVRNGLICIIVAVNIWQIVTVFSAIQYTDHPEGYYATNEATTTVSNEYMPIWVGEMTQERPTVRIAFQKGRGTIEGLATTQKIHVTVDALEDSVMQINSVYYPGWGVLVNDVPIPILYDNPNGVIRFPVLKGKNRIVAEFRETVPRFIADVLSVVCLGSYVGYILYRKKFHKQ